MAVATRHNGLYECRELWAASRHLISRERVTRMGALLLIQHIGDFGLQFLQLASRSRWRVTSIIIEVYSNHHNSNAGQ